MNVQHVLPSDIEKTSLSIIEDTLKEMGADIPEENLAVVKRVIHTTADFDYVKNMAFTKDAVKRIMEILHKGGVKFITDTTMALSGISKPSLAKLNASAECFVANETVIRNAKDEGCTRSAAAVSYAAHKYDTAAFVSGNAPTCLLRLVELMEEGYRPAFVIAVPVGFVNVVESKIEIMDICRKMDVPCIAAMGQKGGSNVAAAICNAILYTACDTLDPKSRGWL